MITTIKLISILITSLVISQVTFVCVCVCVYVVRTLKLCPLSNIKYAKQYIITIPYIRFPELINFITECLFPLTNVLPFPHQTSVTTLVHSVSKS